MEGKVYSTYWFRIHTFCKTTTVWEEKDIWFFAYFDE